MKEFITLLISALAVSCAPKAIIPKAVPAPAQRLSALPEIDKASNAAAQTAAHSRKLEARLETIRTVAGEQVIAAVGARAEAQRLREQKSATENELAGLTIMLGNSERLARDLFAEAEGARVAKQQGESLREALGDALANARILAGEKEIETQSLRIQRDHFAAEFERVAMSDLTARADVERLKGQRAMLLWTSGGMLLLLAVAAFVILR
ncbi:MAG: hypothetical protein V4733_03760 [Verrucomicrobiota bacterium]